MNHHVQPPVLHYLGQDYDPDEYALTVVSGRCGPKVFLVPVSSSGRLLIELLHRWLDDMGIRWSKSHTVFTSQRADYVNHKLEIEA